MWEFNVRGGAVYLVATESCNSFTCAWMVRFSDQYPSFLGRSWLHGNTHGIF